MAGYIGNIPVPQGTQTRQNFTATASQTSFPTIGYTAGFIDVYLNGVKLISGTDFTASNGSDVVLASAASASDVLDVVIFDTFNTSSGTFSDTTLKNNVTLKNDTEEDSDGGRASKIIYQGEQSGGEISTLAEIQASHDGTADDQKGDLIFKTNDGSDNAAPTEAARIDSSRNVLVGKTAVGSTAGIEFRGSIGYSSFTRDGNFPITARRLTDDGDIIQFEKDTTVVGSIGVDNSDNLFISGNSSHSGIMISSSDILPYKNGSISTETQSLGTSSFRWKDLYLSGGAYIGGTGAANKLEDYEEGTWTPVLKGGATTVTTTAEAGTYVKIGNFVMVQGKVKRNDATGHSGILVIDGLPFNRNTITNLVPLATGWGWVDNSTGADKLGFPYLANSTALQFVMDSRVDTTNRYLQIAQLNNARSVYFSAAYRAS